MSSNLSIDRWNVLGDIRAGELEMRRKIAVEQLAEAATASQVTREVTQEVASELPRE